MEYFQNSQEEQSDEEIEEEIEAKEGSGNETERLVVQFCQSLRWFMAFLCVAFL